jgi:hypothetical protein
MKRLNILLVLCLAATTGCLAQDYKMVSGVFASKGDARLRLVISDGRFTYIDSRKGGDLATPCCDTLTYGEVSLDRGGYLLLKSDRSLNPIFVGMTVAERTNPGSDSVEFIIRNPIESQYHKYNSEGGDLIYTLAVEAAGQASGYFKENQRPVRSNRIRFFNPKKAGITSISLTIQPQGSIFVKNLVVREMNTDTYMVRDKGANVFEITLPQLSYGFISYLRLDGDYAKILDKDRIVWKGKEFVKVK